MLFRRLYEITVFNLETILDVLLVTVLVQFAIIAYIYNQIGYLCFVIVTVIASLPIKINKIVKKYIYRNSMCL
jgi:hypothetical protein